MTVWKLRADQQSGYLFSLSDSLRIAEAKHPAMLVPVDGATMIVASDYSGQHKEASHEAYAFLVTTTDAMNDWLPLLGQFRREWLPDGRRISFKKLGETLRWKALPAFLETAGHLKGNLITILVDKRVGSFMLGGPAAVVETFPDCFASPPNYGTVEKMFRLASFIAMLIAGFRRENQLSNWISDHDEALDTNEKREKFRRLATYITFGLTGWRQPADHFFGTTESPLAPYWSEDLAAVPDIAAGAYCQLSAHLPTFFGRSTWEVAISSDIESQRARVIANWLAEKRGQLKHALLRLEKDSEGNVRASAQAFIART